MASTPTDPATQRRAEARTDADYAGYAGDEWGEEELFGEAWGGEDWGGDEGGAPALASSQDSVMFDDALLQATFEAMDMQAVGVKAELGANTPIILPETAASTPSSAPATPQRPASVSAPSWTPTPTSAAGAPPAWLQEVNSIGANSPHKVDLDAAACRVQSVMDGVSQAMLEDGSAVLKSVASNAVEDAGDPDEDELAFKEAAENGWKARGCKMETEFKNALLVDAALKRRWEKLADAKGQRGIRTLQQNFKKEWASTRWQELQVERIRRETAETRDSMEGTWYPFEMMVKKEGGGPQGHRRAVNYVNRAVMESKKGATLKGRPYVVFNEWTGSVEILYVKARFSDSHFLSKTIQKRQVDAATVSRNVAARLSSAARPVKAASDPYTEKDGGTHVEAGADDNAGSTAETAADDNAGSTAKGKGKGKHGKGKRGAAKGKAKEKESTDAQKELALALREMTALKSREAMATQASLRLLETIREHPEWSWANHDQMLGPLRASRETLNAFMHQDTFWTNWAIKDDWASYAKKNLTEQVIMNHVAAEKPILERHLSSLEAETMTLKRMHESRHAQPGVVPKKKAKAA